MEDKKKRRCLKFTGYIYVPNKEDIDDNGIMKYWVGKHPGRIQFFDEDGEKVSGNMKTFNSIGDLSNKICIAFFGMWKSRFKK